VACQLEKRAMRQSAGGVYIRNFSKDDGLIAAIFAIYGNSKLP
jgi:hypothetical protein